MSADSSQVIHGSEMIFTVTGTTLMRIIHWSCWGQCWVGNHAAGFPKGLLHTACSCYLGNRRAAVSILTLAGLFQVKYSPPYRFCGDASACGGSNKPRLPGAQLARALLSGRCVPGAVVWAWIRCSSLRLTGRGHAVGPCGCLRLRCKPSLQKA